MDELLKTEQEPHVPVPSYSSIDEGYQSALKVVDDVVLKNYITNLSEMDVVPVEQSEIEKNILDNVRFFKITEMVYEKDELATDKFASVFNTLSVCDSTLFIVIDSDGEKTDFYMGVRSTDPSRTIASLKNKVENSLKGQFPGSKTKGDYTIEEMQGILDKICVKSISSVSGVAGNKAQKNGDNKNFVQGLEKLVLSMHGEKYTGIILANSTTQNQLAELRKNYETVYSQLSAFSQTQVNYVNNKSYNFSMTESEGGSDSVSHNETKTTTQSVSSSKSSSHSRSVSKEGAASKAINGIAAASSIIGAALAIPTGGASLAVGGIVSGGLGLLGNALKKTVSNSDSSGTSDTTGTNISKGKSDGTTTTTSFNISGTKGYSGGFSDGMILTLHDKTVEDILQRIDRQLKRIDEFESLGMYECTAYFMSDNQYSAEVAASTYKALMRGENSGVEISAVNSWGQAQKQKTQMIADYVKNFMHPVFEYSSFSGNIEVTPCSLVSGNELAVQMGLPRHSVYGFPVVEHADFAKEIVTYGSEKNNRVINLGNVFNMGSVCKNRVNLDINSLSMHTFITGSTGSGKSNTVYELLRQLDNAGVHYLVVESAKGEYKNVLGHHNNVRVFGTNQKFTHLLRINPFKFPQGIHVLEHIDRLVEIFNVCWPMYAAMPAILKEAVLKSYENCGWNLTESVNNYSDELFPTFTDLLDELVAVISSSAYSEEVKSNYTGSLVTRIKSLANGLNSQIFNSNELCNAELFDNNAIVDLSRIGSSEIKSLIMGVLIMRLNEYRMSTHYEMNMPLRHVTVLEEAHNILKKTSTEQNSEGANVAGKAVEMISNSIAEMRTYGEGFIIADQSPNSLDASAIRNTNTKIIMRLPDEQDRLLAGKSAGVKNNQLDEITKLPKGVAVIYQNDWVDPVLCKINKYNGEVKFYELSESERNLNVQQSGDIILRSILKKAEGEKLEYSVGELKDMVTEADLPSKVKINILKALDRNGTESLEEISSAVYDLVCTPDIETESEKTESIEEWKDTFVYSEGSLLRNLDERLQNAAVECILIEQIKRYNKPPEYIDLWNDYLKGVVM